MTLVNHDMFFVGLKKNKKHLVIMKQNTCQVLTLMLVTPHRAAIL